MNAPLPGRLPQFLDRKNLAAQTAGTATTARDKSGFNVRRLRCAKRRAALVLSRHVSSSRSAALARSKRDAVSRLEAIGHSKANASLGCEAMSAAAAPTRRHKHVSPSLPHPEWSWLR